MEEPPIPEEEMSANQKRKAEAAKIKQENEQREKMAALERKRKEEERLRHEKEQKERDDHAKVLENIFKNLESNKEKQDPPKKAANFEDIMKEQAQSLTKSSKPQQKKDPNVIHFDYLDPHAKLPDAGKSSVAEVATVSFEENAKSKGGKKPSKKWWKDKIINL